MSDEHLQKISFSVEPDGEDRRVLILKSRGDVYYRPLDPRRGNDWTHLGECEVSTTVIPDGQP